jgi:hypothetical protein
VIIVADGWERVKLTTGGEPLIAGFAVGNKLYDKNRNRAKQQDMNEPALMQKELKDEPDYEEYCAKRPHFEYF